MKSLRRERSNTLFANQKKLDHGRKRFNMHGLSHQCSSTELQLLDSQQTSQSSARGGHSHRHCSHSCDRGHEAVKGSRVVFGVGQAVKVFTLCVCILHIV